MNILSIILMSVFIMLIIPKTIRYIMGGYRSLFRSLWRVIPKLFRWSFRFLEGLFVGCSNLASFLKKELTDLFKLRP